METFLSHEWVGIALALPAACAAFALLRWCRGIERRSLRWPALGLTGLVTVVATLLALGAAFHVVQRAHDRASNPAPGKLYDIGGYRLHLFAEGSGSTVVWIPGGYAQGLGSYPLHERTRGFARSVLYDHAGTGWSESGPYPRTVAREVDDLKRLLDASGEHGPYVLVGHSFGGLIASNFAFRYPRDTAGLVLLDATPVASARLSSDSAQVALMKPMMRASALAHAFGLSPFITTVGGFFVPASYEDSYAKHVEALGSRAEAFRANERRVSSNMAASSIVPSFFLEPLDALAQAPGALKDLPMAVVYTDTLDVASWSEEHKAELRKAVKSDEDWNRQVAQVNKANREVELLSSHARRISPPAGSTHSFPQEHPEFCVDLVRDLLREIATARGTQ
jgi:pimeloyl-ACP methyl ester carboxylesterase